MKSSEIRRKFIDYYKKRGHQDIPSASLVPENDPTTLFNSCGMQPLVPYLLGQPHPMGKRLVNSQKSFRSQDIDEVGDNRHTTFFEMLGNWSLGDYFKKEQLAWIFTFLINELHLDPTKLYVTIFKGTDIAPRDLESELIWKNEFLQVSKDYLNIGIKEITINFKPERGIKHSDRIFYYDDKKNWWSRSGPPDKMPLGEPGGPDSEVFYDFGEELKLHENSIFKNQPCHPNCDCGRFIEIANSVFMEYQKAKDGGVIPLMLKNVDFGGGLERMNAAANHTPDIFLTDSFESIIKIIEDISHIEYGKDEKETKSMRIIADHIRGAVMMMADGVIPSNKAQGYILRRLIRRSLLYSKYIGIWGDWHYLGELTDPIADLYRDSYPNVNQQKQSIKSLLNDEAVRFGKTVEKGWKEIEKMKIIDGKKAFFVYETYGFPWELTEEIARNRGQTINKGLFEEEFKKHQDLSRTATSGMFKGGLVNQSEKTTKLHTATHILHQALRIVLGSHVQQKGSNITAERLRFDFSHTKPISSDEKARIESIVNKIIKENLSVTYEEIEKEKALQSGALGFFTEKYGKRVKVYSIGDLKGQYFSREICGGPHVDFTGTLGHFTIKKEESLGSGIRRIYAQLEV